MQHQNTIFHALLKTIPRSRFEAIVRRHEGDYRVRQLSCWSQFVAMLYAQLSGSQSLREVEAALESHSNCLYHLGVKRVRRSTLSDANAVRPVAIFETVFGGILAQLQGKPAKEAQEVVRLIDATPVRLNETLSGWARFSDHSTAAKAHVVYDPNAEIPTYFTITPARVNDVVEGKKVPIEPGATYVFDKGYYNFGWWAELNATDCWFVTRLKKNTRVTEVSQRPVSDPLIVSDRLVQLNRRMARNRRNPYQSVLREIIVLRDNGETLRLVTNDLASSASKISALYKLRWQIELFFKWIKQNLRIKKFLGTSENAVKIQIIVAMIAYLLIRFVHQAYPNELHMQTLARLIKTNLMHRKTIIQLLSPPRKSLPSEPDRQAVFNLDYAFS